MRYRIIGFQKFRLYAATFTSSIVTYTKSHLGTFLRNYNIFVAPSIPGHMIVAFIFDVRNLIHFRSCQLSWNGFSFVTSKGTAIYNQAKEELWNVHCQYIKTPILRLTNKSTEGSLVITKTRIGMRDNKQEA